MLFNNQHTRVFSQTVFRALVVAWAVAHGLTGCATNEGLESDRRWSGLSASGYTAEERRAFEAAFVQAGDVMGNEAEFIILGSDGATVEVTREDVDAAEAGALLGGHDPAGLSVITAGDGGIQIVHTISPVESIRVRHLIVPHAVTSAIRRVSSPVAFSISIQRRGHPAVSALGYFSSSSPLRPNAAGGDETGSIQQGLIGTGFSGDGFIRGDFTGDGTVDLSDGIRLLHYLFRGGSAPACEDAGDVDDNGELDLSDAILILNYLFRGGAPFPAPFPSAGTDPTEDSLTCSTAPPSTGPPATDAGADATTDAGIDAAAKCTTGCTISELDNETGHLHPDPAPTPGNHCPVANVNAYLRGPSEGECCDNSTSGSACEFQIVVVADSHMDRVSMSRNWDRYQRGRCAVTENDPGSTSATINNWTTSAFISNFIRNGGHATFNGTDMRCSYTAHPAIPASGESHGGRLICQADVSITCSSSDCSCAGGNLSPRNIEVGMEGRGFRIPITAHAEGDDNLCGIGTITADIGAPVFFRGTSGGEQVWHGGNSSRPGYWGAP